MGTTTKTGVDLIAEERRRQVLEKGWTLQHDADEHTDGSLLAFAGMLAQAVELGFGPDDVEPGEKGDWVTPAVIHALRKHPDSVRRLAIAGALIAAEIDRLQGRES